MASSTHMCLQSVRIIIISLNTEEILETRVPLNLHEPFLQSGFVYRPDQ